MSGAREDILGRIRAGLGRGALEAAIGDPEPGPVPARGQVAGEARIDLFGALAEAVSATVARVDRLAELPGAVADYLASQNLAAAVLATPDAVFDRVPWGEREALEVRRGAPGKDDAVVLSCAFAAVAETGSLLMIGEAANPHLASFVPETAIVVVFAERIVGTFEEAWARVRAAGPLPHALCFVTGPSRTGDIGLRIEVGAHGPRRLHIVIVDGDGQGA